MKRNELSEYCHRLQERTEKVLANFEENENTYVFSSCDGRTDMIPS